MIEKMNRTKRQDDAPDKGRRDFLRFTALGGAAVVAGGLGMKEAEAQEVSLDAATKEILQAMKDIPEYNSLLKSHQFFVANCVAAFMLSAGDDGAKLSSGFEPLQNKAALDVFIVPAYKAFLAAEMARRAEQRAGDEIPDALKGTPGMPSKEDLAAMYVDMHVPKVEAVVESIIKYAERKAPKL